MTTSTPEARPSLLARVARTTFGVLVMWLMLLWAIEIVDTVVLDSRLQGNGIMPREVDGLDGVLWAPFLHAGFGHLISNSVPLVFLGFLVSLQGRRYWLLITAAAIVVGGGLTWLLGGDGNHIGASGVVFGYFGALLSAAFYDRRPRSLAPALVAVLLYSGLVVGVIPQAGISWEGHLFGLVAGALAARAAVRARRRPAPVTADDGPTYPWELDEPWLDT